VELDEALRQAQAEPGAFGRSSGAIPGLAELLEDPGLVFGRRIAPSRQNSS